VKQKISLTLHQKKLVNSGQWITVFNQIHNSHLLVSTGTVKVEVKNGKKKTKNL